MDTSQEKIKNRSDLESILRVNHAGEFSAVKIYEGQLKVLCESSIEKELRHILDQETKHRDLFEAELKKRNIHPTLFQPIWGKISYGLGVGSALLGKKAAMACTVAVEEVIEEHYKDQLDSFSKEPPSDVKTLIHKCYQEEVEHKDTALEHEVSDSKKHEALSKVVKVGCRAAIWLSKRL
ncbi:demethoxyubiquinone hydroxylase family protein [Alphaproteobacteria bacterium]|nr:demethoxyubiquinone hydroxylase family protein [Alphaproteobacteria bacterium]